MRLPALLTSDLHFVVEPACEYRWGLWPWLRDTAKRERCKTICILGDLVDRKDNHPAILVNRLADEVKRTRDEGYELNILAGNHDWLKEGEEFFRFLRHLDGVNYIVEPWEHPDVKGPLALFLPFTRSPMKAWRELRSLDFYGYVFMHQTVRGSVASTGERLDGDNLPDLSAAGKVYSGDIHVPQVVHNPIVGDIEYVGAPYHVHFGDNFKPRVVLLENDRHAVDLHVPGMPKRVTVKATSMEHLKSFYWENGDQAKIQFHLQREDFHRWAAIRHDVSVFLRSRGVYAHGIELVAVGGDGRRITHNRAYRLSGMTAEQAVAKYVEDGEFGGDAYEVGMQLLEPKP